MTRGRRTPLTQDLKHAVGKLRDPLSHLIVQTHSNSKPVYSLSRRIALCIHSPGIRIMYLGDCARLKSR